MARVRCTAPEWIATIWVDKDHVTCRRGIFGEFNQFSSIWSSSSQMIFSCQMMLTQLWRMALTRTGRVQWASSWSNAQRRDTISQPASLPIAKASMPPRSFSHAFTVRFVGPSMNGLPRKPGCARPRCSRDHLAQADRHIAEASRELCPLCRATKITCGICIISAIADSGAAHAHHAISEQFRIRS